MRNNNKKVSVFPKRATTNVVNIRDQPKRTSHETKPSQKLNNNKPFFYYNRKVNTQCQEMRLSETKPSNRKPYILSKGNAEKIQKLNRKSYSKEIHDSKILDGKTFDFANRFTLTQFNLQDGRNQAGYCLGSALLKKNTRKPAQKESSNNINYQVVTNNVKKYRSPYDKPIKKEPQNNYVKPIDIKSIPKPRVQRRMATQANQNQQRILFSHQVQQIHIQKSAIRKDQVKSFIPPSRQVEIIEQIGQGTFGKVYKGVYGPKGQVVAVKKVLQDPKYKSRELQIIQMLKSDFTMKAIDTFITSQESKGERQQYLNIIMEHYDCNLYEYLGHQGSLTNTLQLKVLLYQMFRGLLYIHSLGICHRDIKPHNMLVKHGRVCICDFGSAKILKKHQVNLSYICSRCYRAPELIFGSVNYTTQIDIWSAGCIILEILNKVPLFIGENSLDHLVQVIKVMGTPSKSEVIAMNPEYDLRQYDFPQIPKMDWIKLFPNTDPKLLDLISKVMRYSPQQRLKASQVLAHQYFDDIRSQNLQKEIKLISRTSSFFQFTLEQLKTIKDSSKVIPAWYQSKSKYEKCLR